MSMTMRERLLALLLLCTNCAFSWLAMMVVHEFGHVLNAWFSGGRVTHVVLHPLAISRTDLGENPHPLFVAWGGVVWGAALPLVLWLIAKKMWKRCAFLFKFFAGFCLIANGAYVGSAIVMPVGDSEDLLRLGAPVWMLVGFGALAVVGGLTLWNGLGASFGFGGTVVDRRALRFSAAGLIVLLGGMTVWTFFGR